MARAALRQTLGPALISASLSVIAALSLSYIAAIPTPAELFADQATIRIPLPIFESLLTTFGPAAKHFYLIGALITEMVLTSCVGVAYVSLRQTVMARKSGNTGGEILSWLDAPLIVITLWILSAGLLALIIGGGFLGADLVGGTSGALFSQIAPDCVFAIALIWQLRSVTRLSSKATKSVENIENLRDAHSLTRRALILQSATAVTLLGVGIGIWEALTSGLGSLLGAGPARKSPPSLSLGSVPDRIIPPPTPVYSSWTPVEGQTAELTSAAKFYYVSKNLANDPSLSADSWTLSISGMVDTPYHLTYEQIRALPQLRQYHTLECISNEVGGPLISNGLFTGVRLADILNAARIQPGVNQMTFTAADGYSDSVHLAQALDERSLIVYLLDGAPLPHAHGFPARLLVPGLYGMKNGKWLTELRMGASTYLGYWEQRGWTPEAVVKLMARIDTPQDGDLLVAGRISIAGVAYSGARGIARVDISVDGGRSWGSANLRRPLGALSWTLWEYSWRPVSGQYIIAARAVDLAGYVQTPHTAPPLPDGSSGYHAISVTVR